MSPSNSPIIAGPVEIFVSGANELALDRSTFKDQLLARLRNVPAFRAAGITLDLFHSEPVTTAEEMATRLERLTTGVRIFLRFLPSSDQQPHQPAPIPPGLAAEFTEDIRGWSQAAIEQAWAQQQFAGLGGTLLIYRASGADQVKENADQPAASDPLVIERCYSGLEDLLCLLVDDIERAWEHYVRSKRAARGNSELESDLSTAIEEDQPPQPLDEVQFTVYKPRSAQPGRWYTLLSFAHLADRPLDADADELDPAEEVSQQARQILGEESGRYSPLTQDSTRPIPHEAELTFVPALEHAVFNPPRRSFLWTEPVHREEFRFRISADAAGSIRGRVTVFLGAIIVAELPITVRVESAGSDRANQFETTSARPYRKIFPSYSHRDSAVVAQFEHYARVLGDEYLRDAVHLRTGQVWTEELRRLIQAADIFQLFWSSSSMRSPYVRDEWEYALSLQRPHFVRPTYWEEPFPAAPAEDLPPRALKRLHFQFLGAPRVEAVIPAENGPHQPSTSPPIPVAAAPPLPQKSTSRSKRKHGWLAAMAIFLPVFLAAFFIVRATFLGTKTRATGGSNGVAVEGTPEVLATPIPAQMPDKAMPSGTAAMTTPTPSPTPTPTPSTTPGR